MDVRPGYYTTEVGVIPENWKVELLGTRASFRTGPFGSALHQSDYVQNGVPVINPMHINSGQMTPSAEMTVSNETAKRLAEFRMKPGDIIIGRRGEMGRCAVVREAQAGWVCGTGSMLIRAHMDNPDFLQRTLSSPAAIKAIEEASVGTTMVNLNQAALSRLHIPVPPIEEQTAIATALGDMDALLDRLDRLIAKKRAIKQAAMQQLLTGRIRLPGFDEPWQVSRLGDIANIKTGSRNNEDKVENGRYPFFVRSETVERINSYAYDGEAVLVPGEGRIGDIFHYVNGKFDVHQRVYAIAQFPENISARFVYFYMAVHFGAWAMQNTVKATVDSLRLPTFKEFQITMPLALQEQTAIATILSDMDAEITALESRRNKTRALKQAMMQELLTGKTRLVQPS